MGAILFTIEMVGSSIVAKLSKEFVGRYELDLLLMAIAISLMLTGLGRISVERNALKKGIISKGQTNGVRTTAEAVSSHFNTAIIAILQATFSNSFLDRIRCARLLFRTSNLVVNCQANLCSVLCV